MSNQEPEETNSSNGAAGLLASTDRHIGKRLKSYRERAGMSASQVARALGILEAQVQAIEAGCAHVNASRLFEFGKVLDVPVAYFFAPDDF